ncbi:MAG TPA: hypothetical protein VIJ95_10155 [Hanamia sp.]
MRKLLFTGMLFFVTIAATCQDIYVTNSGDTIHGKIDNYKEWAKNPQEVFFDENTGKNIILTPLNCKSFSVDNSDTYISYSGTRIINSDDITNISGLKDSVKTTEHINAFLRKIYQYREFTLYKFIDSKRTNFFLSKNDTLKELEYYQYADDDGHVYTDDGYKLYILSQLKDINAANKMDKINGLVYKEDALINFFANIFNDKVNATEKKRNKYPNEMFAGVDVHGNFGTIDYDNGTSYGFNGHQTSLAPSVEIGMRLYSQRNFGKLFFQPSLAFSVLDNNFSQPNALGYKTHATLLSVKLGPGYTFVKKSNIRVYAALQFGLDFIFDYQVTRMYDPYISKMKSPATLIKFTFNPEVGLKINHSINIALQGTLPYTLPIYFVGVVNGSPYKIFAVGIVFRYVF